MLKDTFSKISFMMKRMKKKIFFHAYASILYRNNIFAIENDKTSHFENFNNASHLMLCSHERLCQQINMETEWNTLNSIEEA